MSELASQITDLLALGTVVAQLLILALIAVAVLKPRFLDAVRPYAMPAAFLIAFLGSALTLVYSEIFAFAPCGLCWLQRIFLYPLPIIAAIAYAVKDTGAWRYVIGLSIPGLLVALYQHFIQMGGSDVLPCPAAPGASDCAQRLIFEFGYITFPLMAATAFALIITIMLVSRKR